jgi:hypothetical protein
LAKLPRAHYISFLTDPISAKGCFLSYLSDQNFSHSSHYLSFKFSHGSELSALKTLMLMVQCSHLHRIFIFALFSTRFRKSGQCRPGRQVDVLSGEQHRQRSFECCPLNNSAYLFFLYASSFFWVTKGSIKVNTLNQDDVEKENPNPNTNDHRPIYELNSVKKYSTPVFKAEEGPSTKAGPSTPQSREDDYSKLSTKDLTVTNSAINLSPPSASPGLSTPLYDVKRTINQIPSTTPLPHSPKSTLNYDKQQDMIVTRDIIIAISILTVSLLLIGLIWLALIVFVPMIRSSRMKVNPRYWFKRKRKVDHPPEWWTQFRFTSQFSNAEAFPALTHLRESANSGKRNKNLSIYHPVQRDSDENISCSLGRSLFASTQELEAGFNPSKVDWLGKEEEDKIGVDEQQDLDSRLESWLRRGERGNLSSANVMLVLPLKTVTSPFSFFFSCLQWPSSNTVPSIFFSFHKDPSLGLTRHSILLPVLPSLAPSDSASRLR